MGAAKHSSLPPTNPITPADAVKNAAAEDDRNRIRVEYNEHDDTFVL